MMEASFCLVSDRVVAIPPGPEGGGGAMCLSEEGGLY